MTAARERRGKRRADATKQARLDERGAVYIFSMPLILLVKVDPIQKFKKIVPSLLEIVIKWTALSVSPSDPRRGGAKHTHNLSKKNLLPIDFFLVINDGIIVICFQL